MDFWDKHKKSLVKQVGAIVFGGGLNVVESIEQAKRDGFYVVVRGHHAELYADIA